MARKILLSKRGGKHYSKSIEVLDNPRELLPALSPLAWWILCELSNRPSYPNELARKLKIHEQKVYYHIRKLKRSGLIEVVKEERKQGAVCKYFSPICDAFGIEVGGREERIKIGSEKSYLRVEDFFKEFIRDGIFNGSIVVGSPLQHGPYLTAARDGHYAVQLAIFLGAFCELSQRFVVKLDTEVRAEHEEKRNMILIGGPITNIIAADINERLKIRFRWENGWRIFSEISGKEYTSEDLGLIAKIKNPWDGTKAIILLAGLKFEGTKSCIIALTQHFDRLLKGYSRGADFSCLIRGLDRDGDGKVDDVEILENIN